MVVLVFHTGHSFIPVPVVLASMRTQIHSDRGNRQGRQSFANMMTKLRGASTFVFLCLFLLHDIQLSLKVAPRLYSVKLAQTLTVNFADVYAELQHLQQQDRPCILNKSLMYMSSRKPYSQVPHIVWYYLINILCHATLCCMIAICAHACQKKKNFTYMYIYTMVTFMS